VTPKLSVREFSIYEVVGYLLPGLTLVLWTLLLFSPGAGDGLREAVGPVVFWLLVVIVSYSVGHLLQAVGNYIPRWPKTESASEIGLDPKVLDGCAACVLQVFGVDRADTRGVYSLCDAYVQRHGCFAERDLHTYREGYYRAMALVAAVAAVECIALYAATGGISLVGRQFAFREAALLCLFLVMSGWLFYLRYLRFRRFRIRGVYMAFCDCALDSGSGSNAGDLQASKLGDKHTEGAAQ